MTGCCDRKYPNVGSKHSHRVHGIQTGEASPNGKLPNNSATAANSNILLPWNEAWVLGLPALPLAVSRIIVPYSDQPWRRARLPQPRAASRPWRESSARSVPCLPTTTTTTTITSSIRVSCSPEFSRWTPRCSPLFLQDPKAVKMRRHAFHLHQCVAASPPLPSPEFLGFARENLNRIDESCACLVGFSSRSGSTTLSASALLLPPGSLAEPPPLLDRICAAHGHAGGVALTSASLVEPFLVEEQRNSPSQVGFSLRISAIWGVSTF